MSTPMYQPQIGRPGFAIRLHTVGGTAPTFTQDEFNTKVKQLSASALPYKLPTESMRPVFVNFHHKADADAFYQMLYCSVYIDDMHLRIDPPSQGTAGQWRMTARVTSGEANIPLIRLHCPHSTGVRIDPGFPWQLYINYGDNEAGVHADYAALSSTFKLMHWMIFGSQMLSASPTHVNRLSDGVNAPAADPARTATALTVAPRILPPRTLIPQYLAQRVLDAASLVGVRILPLNPFVDSPSLLFTERVLRVTLRVRQEFKMQFDPASRTLVLVMASMLEANILMADFAHTPRRLTDVALTCERVDDLSTLTDIPVRM